jgi:hypothetical protein
MYIQKTVDWNLRILAVLAVISFPNYLYITWLGAFFDPYTFLGIKTLWFVSLPMIIFQFYIIFAGIKLWYMSLWLYPIFSIFYLAREMKFLINNHYYKSISYLSFQMDALFFSLILLLGTTTLIVWLYSKRNLHFFN